jgi:hypothetical protein
MNSARLKTIVTITLAGASLVLLSGWGGTSVVSASAVATCAHARQQPEANLAPHTPSQHEVVAKVVSGGWLYQSYAEQRANATGFELYVLPSNKAAEESFNLISNAPNAAEEYGGGGTFRRKNVIISTASNPPYSLTTYAETLLNKCVGAGASQSVLRSSHEEVIDGRTRSEITRAEEKGEALLGRTGGEAVAPTETTQEPTQEPPSSEDRTNPGQSPIPGEGE